MNMNKIKAIRQLQERMHNLCKQIQRTRHPEIPLEFAFEIALADVYFMKYQPKDSVLDVYFMKYKPKDENKNNNKD